MFANETETRSVVDNVVAMRPLYDEDDNTSYPLYSADVPIKDLVPIRHIWNVTSLVWPMMTTIVDNERDALTHVLVLYASWAYGKMVPDSPLQMADLAREVFLRPEIAFTVETFMSVYRRAAAKEKLRLVKTITAEISDGGYPRTLYDLRQNGASIGEHRGPCVLFGNALSNRTSTL